jgi:DNA-binding NarL/FixJ family response regulator
LGNLDRASIQLFPPRLSDLRTPSANHGFQASEQPMPGTDIVRSLSRRELVILRTLTEGASNKIIARKLVITESTVKVHMKAILRKLRLQNRTQAAIWARTHLGELLVSAA